MALLRGCHEARHSPPTLWELIAADVAEAKLVELCARRIQLMQPIHHVVMPALEPFVDPRRVQDRQVERSLQEKPALTIGERHERVEADVWNDWSAGELHRNSTVGKVIDTDRIAERGVETTDRVVLILTSWNSEDWIDFGRDVRRVGEIHTRQAQIGQLWGGVIESFQQHDERIAGTIAGVGPNRRRGRQDSSGTNTDS